MNPLDTMQAFVRVAELASFTQAAQSLGLPKASVSTSVQKLETQLGTRLLHRTTRRVQMTQDGLAFYERCKDLMADMEELQAMFQPGDAELQGRLRVDMPMGVARNVVLPRLPELLRLHPKLEIELSSTDRRVDVVREGFDCVLRIGGLGDSSLIARPLAPLPQINCLSRSYIEAHGEPASLDELAAHRLVHYASTLGTRSPGFEYVDAVSGETRLLAMAGALTVNNSEAYLAACRAGLGLIQVPELGMRPFLASGELVEVLPGLRPPVMPVSILYANRRHQPKRVQVFMSWLAELMGADTLSRR